MGMSISWFGVKNISQFDILGASGLDLDSTTHDNHLDHPRTIGELQDGWNIVFFNRNCDDAKLYSEDLIQSCLEDEIIICSYEEHVMTSYVEMWSKGKLIWSISHDPNKGMDEVEVTGQLSDEALSVVRKYEELQKKSIKENEGVDHLIEGPLQVAKLFTRFHHLEELNGISSIQWNGIKGGSSKGCLGIISLFISLGVGYSLYQIL